MWRGVCGVCVCVCGVCEESERNNVLINDEHDLITKAPVGLMFCIMFMFSAAVCFIACDSVRSGLVC